MARKKTSIMRLPGTFAKLTSSLLLATSLQPAVGALAFEIATTAAAGAGAVCGGAGRSWSMRSKRKLEALRSVGM